MHELIPKTPPLAFTQPSPNLYSIVTSGRSVDFPVAHESELAESESMPPAQRRGPSSRRAGPSGTRNAEHKHSRRNIGQALHSPAHARSLNHVCEVAAGLEAQRRTCTMEDHSEHRLVVGSLYQYPNGQTRGTTFFVGESCWNPGSDVHPRNGQRKA